MVAQHPPFHRAGMPSTIWNCGGVGNACTDGPMSYGDHVDDDDDDDDDSIMEQPPRRAPLPQQLAPQQRMRNLVDGLLSPFMSCVQPPLLACVAPAMDWEPGNGARNCNQPSYSVHSCRSRSSIPQQHRGTSSHGVSSSSSSGLPVGGLKPMISSTSSARTAPNENDILCGRGNNGNRHEGNMNFRELIAANKKEYTNLTKKEKMLMARQIVDLVLNHTDPPARFLGRDTASGQWYDIGIPRSLEKTSQALRERSAVEKAGRMATKICSVPLCDGSVSEVTSGAEEIEVTREEDMTRGEMENEGGGIAAAPALCRAPTPKVSNNRNGPVLPPPVNIPGHLQNFFSHRPPPPPKYMLSPPLSAATLQLRYGAHEHGFTGVPPPPPPPQQQPPPHFLPAFRPSQPPPPLPYGYHNGQGGCLAYTPGAEKSVRPYPPPPPPYAVHQLPAGATMSSPPRQSAPPLPYVTPLGQSDYHRPPTRPSHHQQAPRVAPHHEQPAFHVDVFQNPEFVEKYAVNSSRERPEPSVLGFMLSSTREQRPKRQRTSMIAVNTSTEPFTELKASGERSGMTNSNSSAGLTEAIKSQLTLEDRVIRSPSGLTQSFAGGRRGQQPLPRPPKASSALNLSADSMDGLSALSTAAFLKLDESY